MVQVSIIIVHYRNETDLIECLNSIYSHTANSFEVIVVDNSEKKQIEKKLKTKYKNLKYVPSPKNVGYGAGVNLGAKHASGEFLFVINPDVVFEKDITKSLISKIAKDKKIGIIAPLLLTTDKKIMEQGARELSPLMAIFKLSFINRIWPNNPVSKDYWVKAWNTRKLKKVDTVPGSAFVIRKDLFDKTEGFDERFFLYFEEFDLCKRIRELGYKIYIDPTSKLIHKWGTTTKLLKDRDAIFKKSRFYYFRKHFGIFKAIFVESFLNINSYNLLLLFILISALFLRLYKLNSFVQFYGDIGWFFISARDMILTQNIPLVGITSSHLWLHQGPLWTYIVAFLFYFYHFNPLAPYFFTAILDIFTLLLVFKISKRFFSTKTAMIASALYAFSPAVIISARTAYHTSPIPFFIALFIYGLLRWLNGKNSYFPVAVFSIAALYNFELQTFVLGILLIVILLYGLIKKTSWYKGILNKRYLFLSLTAFMIPMLPVIIYDFRNGFPQTIVFMGWIGYKIFGFISNLGVGAQSLEFSTLLTYLYNFIGKLLFIQNTSLANLLFLLSLGYLVYRIKDEIKMQDNKSIPLFLILMFLLGGIIVGKTPSDAYTMSLFIPLIFIVALFLSSLSKNRPAFSLILLILLAIFTLNVSSLLRNNYFVGFSKGYGPTIVDRMRISKYMIESSRDKSFTIIGKGEGSQFESFLANYRYLTWYYGKEAKPSRGEIIFIIGEGPKEIKVEKYK